jgi:hypothetical protein
MHLLPPTNKSQIWLIRTALVRSEQRRLLAGVPVGVNLFEYAHYSALSAATPLPINDQYPKDGDFERAPLPEQQPPLAPPAVKSSRTPECVFGLARANATQVREFQNNRRCSLSIENEIGKISRFPRPVVVSPTAKLRIPGRTELEQRGSLTNPDMERTERGGGSGCLRRRCWRSCSRRSGPAGRNIAGLGNTLAESQTPGSPMWPTPPRSPFVPRCGKAISLFHLTHPHTPLHERSWWRRRWRRCQQEAPPYGERERARCVHDANGT